MRPPLPPAARAALLVLALGLAVLARAGSWEQVFTDRGIRFIPDGDPWYHVLQAKEIALSHGVRWRDPGLDFPRGAEVPWPPLLDLLVAGVARALPGPPVAARVEVVAAWAPVAISGALVLSGAALAAALLGPWAGVAVAFLLAGSGSLAAIGLLGRPDQHVLEALLFAWLLAGIVRATRRSDVPAQRALAVAEVALSLTLAFWTWLGSALFLVAAGLASAALHVLPEPDDASARRGGAIVAAGALGAAALLALSIATLGPPGALGRVALGGLSAFPVLLAAATSAAAWALLGLRARWGPAPGRARRLAEVAAAGLGAVAVCLLSPGIREAVAHGLDAASRGNAWYASIHEFRHLFSTRFHPLSRELRLALAAYGLAPALAVLGLAELRFRWRERSARATLAAVAAPSLLLVALAGYMWRFGYYAALPLALLSAYGLAALWRLLARAPDLVRAAAAAGAVLLAIAPSVRALAGAAPPVVDVFALEDALAPARVEAPALDGAILASWEMGHHVRYLSNRPVLASPFGVEGGEGAMEDAARAFLAADEPTLEALLRRRGIRWVLLPPLDSAVRGAELFLRGYALQGDPSLLVGPDDRLDENRFARLVVTRLFHLAGSGLPGFPALGAFRLVSEAAPAGGGTPFRLFELVPGASVHVTGPPPGAAVAARTSLRVRGEVLPWSCEATVGPDGAAVLRLPYATGPNGQIRADPWVITDGARTAILDLPEERLLRGGRIDVALGRAR